MPPPGDARSLSAAGWTSSSGRLGRVVGRAASQASSRSSGVPSACADGAASARPTEARNAASRPETSSSRIIVQRCAETVRKSSQVLQRVPLAMVKAEGSGPPATGPGRADGDAAGAWLFVVALADAAAAGLAFGAGEAGRGGGAAA